MSPAAARGIKRLNEKVKRAVRPKIECVVERALWKMPETS